MKILVIGSGGREHALAWKLAQSPGVEVFAAPGNPGMAQRRRRVCRWRPSCRRTRAPDLTVVGPEVPLVDGHRRPVPRARAAHRRSDRGRRRSWKAARFSQRTFSCKADIPTAQFVTVDNAVEARRALDAFGYPGGPESRRAGGRQGRDHRARSGGSRGRARHAQRAAGDRGISARRRSQLHRAVRRPRRDPARATQDHKAVFDGDRGPEHGRHGRILRLSHPERGPDARHFEYVSSSPPSSARGSRASSMPD